MAGINPSGDFEKSTCIYIMIKYNKIICKVTPKTGNGMLLYLWIIPVTGCLEPSDTDGIARFRRQSLKPDLYTSVIEVILKIRYFHFLVMENAGSQSCICMRFFKHIGKMFHGTRAAGSDDGHIQAF